MIVQTPGVYIREKNNLPSSVAGVSTAVPAFIGVTAMQPKDNLPTRITSMFEFQNIYGGGFNPDYVVGITKSGAVPNLTYKVDQVVPNKRFFLYESLALYFQNGGGPCYIISAGTYTTITDLATINAGITAGINELDTLDEVTLVLAPDLYMQFRDGTSGDPTSLAINGEFKALASGILNKCGELDNKFAIFDYLNTAVTALEMRTAMSPSLSADLKYGSLYYPWLVNNTNVTVGLDQLSGYVPVGSPITAADASFDVYTQINKINEDLRLLDIEFSSLSFEGLYKEFEALNAVFAVASGITAKKNALSNVLKYLYQINVKLSNVEGIAATTRSEEFTDKVTALKINTAYIEQFKRLYALVDILKSVSPTSGANYIVTTGMSAPTDVAWFNFDGESDGISIVRANTQYLDSRIIYNNATPFGSPYTPPAGATKKDRSAIWTDFRAGLFLDPAIIMRAVSDLVDSLNYKKRLLEERLFTEFADYAQIKEAIQKHMKQIPTQGAIAGIYCKNDRDRGVWKSPANITVQGIEKPLLELSNAQQDGLNVDPDTGKSINVIRTFTGKGPLVWGARTLAGNDNEWRYVSVRRFFSYAEESILKAMHEFVYEPNNARTWVKIKAMVTSFLVNQWQSGALVGNSMDEAFFVNVGNETTSPDEILNGKINVQIGMAVARPAEFIILEFSHFVKA